MASALAMAASTVFIPLFGAAVTAFLQGSTDGLVAKLVLIDLLAVAALGFHRRLLTLASSAGSRMANRLRWARIGGTGTGDDATRTGQVIATALGMSTPAGYNSGYQGLGLGGIAAFGLAGPGGGGEASGPQAHLLRRARLLAHARAVGDVPGAVLHPGRLAGDAVRHGRHALAPATLVLRGAEHAWKGKPLSPAEWERRTIKPGMGAGFRSGRGCTTGSCTPAAAAPSSRRVASRGAPPSGRPRRGPAPAAAPKACAARSAAKPSTTASRPPTTGTPSGNPARVTSLPRSGSRGKPPRRARPGRRSPPTSTSPPP
ncbi:hypothetical protein ACFQZC_00045 [Streptacidiphilus monticola]